MLNTQQFLVLALLALVGVAQAAPSPQEPGNDLLSLVEVLEVEEPTDTGNATSINGTAVVEEDPEAWRALVDPLIHACPMDCNYRGVCNTGFCECRYPYTGRACEKEICGHNQLCSGRGECVNNTVTLSPSHVCLCDDGWTGPYCDEQDDECPYGCLNHGTCEDGVCACRKGWAGDYCQEVHCPKSCSDHGDCLQDGENGGYCNCTAPWYTESCEIALCPKNCSGSGICDKFTALCSCNDTYAGPACDLRTCPNNCTFPHGSCNMTLGVCNCDPLYIGADCSDELCPSLCSGHGTCHKSGKCSCDDRWDGDDCSIDLCWHNCSYHGFCDASGHCFCHPSFDGDICNIDLRCPSNCSNHGWCSEGRCNCTGGWSSHDCSVSPFTCPNDFECAHGNCSSGACECDRGWRDFDCSLEVVRMCSNSSECYHGHCDDLGQCVCEWPWTGVFCERYMAFPMSYGADGVADIPNPLDTDSASVVQSKLRGFEEHIVGGECGRFGSERCGSPVYRRPHQLTEMTRVPMGIRHSPNRAKANATHAANGTFWGDIWGNATEMWEEIREQQEHADATSDPKRHVLNLAYTSQSSAAAQPSTQNAAAQSRGKVTEEEIRLSQHLQEHQHNVMMARKHFYHARNERQRNEARRGGGGGGSVV